MSILKVFGGREATCSIFYHKICHFLKMVKHLLSFFCIGISILYLMCLCEELPDDAMLSEARWSQVTQGGVTQLLFLPAATLSNNTCLLNPCSVKVPGDSRRRDPAALLACCDPEK